jgi:RNA polymerase sigma-70 factor (ECF subfamily)
MTPEQIIEAALERYERPLLSFAKGITGDLESAKDSVQETFLRLSRQDVAALEPRMAAWLFFVCRNCALDHRRKVVRFPCADAPEEMADTMRSPDLEAVAAEDAARVRQLVEKLPALQRDLVRLKFEAGLSYQEMSDVTKTSVSNVGVQLHLALKTLRGLWARQIAAPAP